MQKQNENPEIDKKMSIKMRSMFWLRMQNWH